MYPFAEPEALDDAIHARLEKVISAHGEFACRLAGLSRWPGVLFASVETDAPFRRLNADLISAFPEFPSDNGGFEFVPHVTIAVGPAASVPKTASDPAWRELPTVCRASRVDLIVRSETRWDVRRSFAMGRKT
jgi:2'-5' RNA ligase